MAEIISFDEIKKRRSRRNNNSNTNKDAKVISLKDYITIKKLAENNTTETNQKKN